MDKVYVYGKEPNNWSPKENTVQYAFYYFTKYFYDPNLKIKFNYKKQKIEVTTDIKTFKHIELLKQNISSFENVPVSWKLEKVH